MKWAATGAILLVRGYQLLLRPLLPAACRFAPSCSEYCRQALSVYGLVRGSAMAARRIARCHPWNPGGYDPLPILNNGRSERPGA